MRVKKLKGAAAPSIINPFMGANFKTSHLAQSRRQAQILILEILNIFQWLIRLRSPSLTLNKLKRFETGSFEKQFWWFCHKSELDGKIKSFKFKARKS